MNDSYKKALVPYNKDGSLLTSYPYRDYWTDYDLFGRKIRDYNRRYWALERLQPVDWLTTRTSPLYDWPSRYYDHYYGFPKLETDSVGQSSYRMRLDVADFYPEEITVKVKDQKIQVYAKHKDRFSNTKVYREYARQYALPLEVNPYRVTARLTGDGVLSIDAPVQNYRPAVTYYRERNVPIEYSKYTKSIKAIDY